MASIHYRVNDTWTKARIVYVKTDGQWVKKLFVGNVLENDTFYIPMAALGLLIDESDDKLTLGDDRILI